MSGRPLRQQGFILSGMANGAEGSTVEEAFIDLANRLADAAAEITTKYFRYACGISHWRAPATWRVRPKINQENPRQTLLDSKDSQCITELQ